MAPPHIRNRSPPPFLFFLETVAGSDCCMRGDHGTTTHQEQVSSTIPILPPFIQSYLPRYLSLTCLFTPYYSQTTTTTTYSATKLWYCSAYIKGKLELSR